MQAKGKQKKQSENGKTLFASSLYRVEPGFLKTALSQYKYVSPNLSLFEKLFLNQFWEMVVKIYPRWLAPNLITFIGFVSAFLAVVTLVIFSPQFKGESPRWWFLFAAICQFIYQTLDGSDGKQARRTKSGSPLGELFDHGVDALVTSFIALFGIEVCSFGLNSPFVCLSFLGIHLAFFFSIFTALHTTKQRFGLIDCQEIQVLVEILLVITAIYGPEMWFNKIPVSSSIIHHLPLNVYDWKTLGDDGIEMRYIITWGASFGSIFSAIGANITVFQYYWKHRNKKFSKEGRGLVSTLEQQLLATLQTILFLISWSAASDLYASDSSALFAWLIMYGLTWADLVNHLLLTRVGQIPFPRIWRSRALLGDIAFYILLLCGSSTSLTYARWMVVLLMFVSNMHYCIMMGNAICDALNIYFFKIPYKKE